MGDKKSNIYIYLIHFFVSQKKNINKSLKNLFLALLYPILLFIV
jgi:hypothetical protein